MVVLKIILSLNDILDDLNTLEQKQLYNTLKRKFKLIDGIEPQLVDPIVRILKTFDEDPRFKQLFFSILYEQPFLNINYDDCNKIATFILDVIKIRWELKPKE